MSSPDTSPTPTLSSHLSGLAANVLNQAVTQGDQAIQQLVSQAADVVHHQTEQWRDLVGAWHDAAVGQIREHPIRSVLVAASVGAVLTLLVRSSHR